MSGNAMEYKGYTALIEYSAEDGCLVGHVIGINDRIGFHGESIAEITRNFHDGLDCYLKACEERGKRPEQPKSGKLSVRLPVELHAIVAQQSEAIGKSLNQMVIDALTATYLDKKPNPNPSKPMSRKKRRETAGIGK